MNRVFNTFLESDGNQAKSEILGYLGLKEPVLDFITEIKNKNFHAWVLLEEHKEVGVMHFDGEYYVVTPEGDVLAIVETLEEALKEIALMVD